MTLISYFGAIIGGFITLYGVRWTIKHNEESMNKNYAIQNQPVLTYEIGEPHHLYKKTGVLNFYFNSKYFDDNSRVTNKSKVIRLMNIGKGDMIDFNIEVEAENLESDTLGGSFLDFKQVSVLYEGNSSSNRIVAGESLEIDFTLPNYKKEMFEEVADRFRNYTLSFTLYLDITFFSIYDDYTYEYTLTLPFSATFELHGVRKGFYDLTFEETNLTKF